MSFTSNQINLLKKLHNLYRENRSIFENDETYLYLIDLPFDEFCKEEYMLFEDDFDFDDFDEYIEWVIKYFGKWSSPM